MSESDDRREDEPEQIALTRRLVELSIQRTHMSAQRSEMSAERSYMNAERTLSVWIRTALAVMVVGIAVDRLRLAVLTAPVKRTNQDAGSLWLGTGLVALGVLIVVATAVRFRLYAAAYRRDHELPPYHGAFMAPAFALLVAIFGVILLVLLLVSPR